ncbi:hypothetical protein KSP40_PGU017733 [Platanthera guangdongensis]|uniref:Uncharacterized protein n=1 Tax=Platanthera guangdongensis TaxID=2320717 RepID=A0ABR2N5J7_9ASPA
MAVKQNQGSLCSVLPDNCMLCLLMITTRKHIQYFAELRPRVTISLQNDPPCKTYPS